MVGRIPEDVIERVASRADIVEVIGEHVALRKAGANYKGLCPFHEEKTPSFMVSPTKQIFKCFGCGVGGNVFNFLMKRDGLSFPEAVEYLAERVGVEIPRRRVGGRAEQLYDVADWACRQFQKLLAHPRRGQKAREYLRRRGLSTDTIDRFRLGYAPAERGWLIARAKADGIPLGRLREAGLTAGDEGEVRDRFRDRLIFPIATASGRIVGFGGRILSDGTSGPKYLNSPETPIYRKGYLLYGLDRAKSAIRKAGMAVLVEGYMDLLRCVEAGVENVVAGCGTALTEDHARLLRRYAPVVCLLYDGDPAGQSAALRGLDVLVGEGLKVRVAVVPGGMDPDDYVGAHGEEGLRSLLDSSVNLVDFKLEALADRHDASTVDGRVAILEEILPTLRRIKGAAERDVYVNHVASRLGMSPEAVREDLLAERRAPGAVRPRAKPDAQRPQEVRAEERMLAQLLIQRRDLVERARELVGPDDLQTPSVCRIVGVLYERPQADPAELASAIADEEACSLLADLAICDTYTEEAERAFSDCVARVRRRALQRRLERLSDELKNRGVEPIDDPEYCQLLRQLKDVVAAAASGSAKVTA